MQQFIAIASLPTRLALALMLMQSIVSCRTTKEVQVVRAVSHDTLYQDKMIYDSVYLDNSVNIDRKGDTVYVREHHIQYKYKFLTKTKRETRTDSIPVIRTVKVKGDAYVPTWCKWMSGTGIAGIIVFMISIPFVFRRRCGI